MQKPTGPEPPLLWGFRGNLAFGVPVAVFAGLHIGFGVFLAATRARVFCIAGAVSSTLAAAFYLFLMVSALGTIPVDLTSLLVVAIPVLVWARAAKHLSSANEENPILIKWDP